MFKDAVHDVKEFPHGGTHDDHLVFVGLAEPAATFGRVVGTEGGQKRIDRRVDSLRF
jgi:hypothetical protein